MFQAIYEVEYSTGWSSSLCSPLTPFLYGIHLSFFSFRLCLVSGRLFGGAGMDGCRGVMDSLVKCCLVCGWGGGTIVGCVVVGAFGVVTTSSPQFSLSKGNFLLLF